MRQNCITLKNGQSQCSIHNILSILRHTYFLPFFAAPEGKRGLFSFSKLYMTWACMFLYALLRTFFGCFFFKCYLYITHTLSHSYDDNGLEKWWFRNTVTAVVKAANNRRMSVSPPELQLGVGAKAAELTNRKKGPFFSF